MFFLFRIAPYRSAGALKKLLEAESVDTRYDLLMNVRGRQSSSLAAIHVAAGVGDLEIT